MARAALREPNLPVAFLDLESREIRLLVDHREDLIAERTRHINRLRWHLHEMRRGGGAPAPYKYRGATAHADADGWETVGNMGWLQEGWLFLADRKADMVVVGGSNVYPAEVEGALEEHPAVLSCCVYGLPDDEYGSVLHAVVQTTGEISDAELVAHLRERLVPYKIPRTFARSQTPIRDDAGKVRRSLLREQTLAVRSTAAL